MSPADHTWEAPLSVNVSVRPPIGCALAPATSSSLEPPPTVATLDTENAAAVLASTAAAATANVPATSAAVPRLANAFMSQLHRRSGLTRHATAGRLDALTHSQRRLATQKGW